MKLLEILLWCTRCDFQQCLRIPLCVRILRECNQWRHNDATFLRQCTMMTTQLSQTILMNSTRKQVFEYMHKRYAFTRKIRGKNVGLPNCLFNSIVSFNTYNVLNVFEISTQEMFYLPKSKNRKSFSKWSVCRGRWIKWIIFCEAIESDVAIAQRSGLIHEFQIFIFITMQALWVHFRWLKYTVSRSAT